jgi:hypothetical protein
MKKLTQITLGALLITSSIFTSCTKKPLTQPTQQSNNTTVTQPTHMFNIEFQSCYNNATITIKTNSGSNTYSLPGNYTSYGTHAGYPINQTPPYPNINLNPGESFTITCNTGGVSMNIILLQSPNDIFLTSSILMGTYPTQTGISSYTQNY